MLNTRNPAVLATLALFWAMPTIAQTALSTTSVTHEAALAGQKAGKTTMKFESATPNLIVSDIERSTAFYRDVLGFEQLQTVPDKAPFVFVWMKQDDVNVFLNVPQPAKEGSPVSLSKAVGGTNTIYIKLNGIDELAARVQQHGVIPAIPMHKEFY